MPPMPTVTRQAAQRATGEEALAHLLEIVLALPTDSETHRALDQLGAKTIGDLISLTPSEIDDLVYEDMVDTEVEDVSVPGMQRINLKKVRNFEEWQAERLHLPVLDDDDWVRVTFESFDSYRRLPPDELRSRAVREAEMLLRLAPIPAAAPAITPVQNSWAQGIKRDPAAYPLFTESKFWDKWNREFQNKASLHGVSNVLIANYVPAPGAETENFAMMKQFVTAVFLSKITLGEAAIVVRKNPDAQICYQLLKRRYENSPQAAQERQLLRRKLQAMTLDGSWKGTASKFLTAFDDAIRDRKSVV